MSEYALEKRNSFGTVGRLRKLMAEYPEVRKQDILEGKQNFSASPCCIKKTIGRWL